MRIQWFSFIRILGLLFVLVYHFYKDFLPGGFIGVDIFFTFSGYLITALLLDEVQKNGKINLLAYFRRRFYRIFPPLLFMVILSIPFALLIREDFRASIGNQIIAALGFVTNFYEMRLGSNYEAQFAPHLLLHTWSLAVEVHYYIFWAIFLALISRIELVAKQFSKVVAFSSGFLFLASFIAMAWGQYRGLDQSQLYYSSLTHSYPLFLGSLLAVFGGLRNQSQAYRFLNERLTVKTLLVTVGMASMALLALAFLLNFTSPITYLIGFLLTSLLAVILIISARMLSDKLSHQSEPKWATILANISYGIYLFHWPLYLITKELMPHELAVLVTTLLSVVLASFSFYVVEPLLMGKNLVFLQKSPAWMKTYIAILMLLVTLLFGGATLLTAMISPQVGHFESEMLDKSLRQYATGMATTRRLVDVGSSSGTSVGDNYENVIVIGDSVALDAFETKPGALGSAIIDNQVSRSFDMAFEVYQNHINSGTLPDFVVLAVGANSVYDYENDIMQFINALPENKHLILVTPYSRNEYPEETKAAVEFERSLVGKYDRVSIADWYQISVDNPELWEGSDGMHFSHTAETALKGSELFINNIIEALAPFKTDSSEPISLDSTLIIGDSVMVHASGAMTATFPTAIIDSQSNRNIVDAVEIIKNYIANNSLPTNVVLAVGVNEITNFQDVLNDLIDSLPQGTRLIFVTPYNGNYVNDKESNINKLRDFEKQLADKNGYITIADWWQVAQEHPEIWEGTDQVHFDKEVTDDYEMLEKASGYFAETIQKALQTAQTKSGK